MALTQQEINTLRQDYRGNLADADAAGAGTRVDIEFAAPNGFTCTFHALDGNGNDVVAPRVFTSQNLTQTDAIAAYRQLRSSGVI